MPKLQTWNQGRCEHVKDILKDGELLGFQYYVEDGMRSFYEVHRCKTCGKIYFGKVPSDFYYLRYHNIPW